MISTRKREAKQTIIMLQHLNWKSPEVTELELQLNAIVSDKKDLIFWLSCFRRLKTVYVSVGAPEIKLYPPPPAELPTTASAINECSRFPLSTGKNDKAGRADFILLLDFSLFGKTFSSGQKQLGLVLLSAMSSILFPLKCHLFLTAEVSIGGDSFSFILFFPPQEKKSSDSLNLTPSLDY